MYNFAELSVLFNKLSKEGAKKILIVTVDMTEYHPAPEWDS